MPLSGCMNGLVVTALVTLVLLPGPFLVPELKAGSGPSVAPHLAPLPHSAPAWFDLGFNNFPPFDLALTALVFIIGVAIYLSQWIQRKILEYRIIKLNKYLGVSVERLRAWDARQERLDATLKVVQDATTEYDLLLYLVLRYNHCPSPPHDDPPTKCFVEEEMFVEQKPLL